MVKALFYKNGKSEPINIELSEKSRKELEDLKKELRLNGWEGKIHSQMPKKEKEENNGN